MEILPLPPEKNVHGYIIKLIRNHDNKYAIYEMYRHDKLVGYEIHKSRVRENKRTKDKLNPKAVSHYYALAGDDDFGIRGWYFQTKEMMELKWNQLIQQ